ncbi:MAG TPA: hypothetical protein VMU28_15835 [Terriglobales bacterium]|nr:hypothetical protein [Terriglobales bacterium]
MKRNEDELERFLDRALAEYSEAPREGLEQRILANLATSPAKTRWPSAWLLVPACAVLISGAVLWLKPEKEVPAPTVVNTVVPTAPNVVPPKTLVVTVAKQPKPHRPKPRVTQDSTAAPRLPTFPSQPDESQARMLLQFVQGSPQTAQQVVKEEEDFQKLVAQNFQDSNHTNGLETR